MIQPCVADSPRRRTPGASGCLRVPGGGVGESAYHERLVGRTHHPPTRKPAGTPSWSAMRNGHAPRIPRTAKNAYTRSKDARAIRRNVAKSAVVPSRIGTERGERLDRRTFPFQCLELPLHFQKDRQDRQDRRVHVGAITRGTRVLPRLRDDAIEGLPVFLP